MTFQLRDYQEQAISKADLYLNKKGGTSGIQHLATGLGKSAITTHTVDQLFPPKQFRTIVIGGQNNVLTYQMAENFRKHFPYMKGNEIWGGKAVPILGIVMNRLSQHDARVVIASIQSLNNGNELSTAKQPPEMAPISFSDLLVDKYGRISLAPRSKRRWLVSPRFDLLLAAGGTFDLWVHDEAHHSAADGSVLIIQRNQELRRLLNLPPMKIIGNTATPARADGKGLHTIYESIFVSYGVPWAQRHGYLVPFADPLRILVDTVEGEDSEEVIEHKTTVRYVNNWDEVLVKGWLEKGQGRPTFAYVSQHNGRNHIEDSMELCRTFQRFGVRAAHVDGLGCVDEKGEEVGKGEQGRILEMLARGQLDVVCNYGVLTEGVDVARTSCVLLARRIDADNPTLLTQIIGRILRPAEGKEDALILEATGQALVLNGIAELGGFKVDPSTGRFIDDVQLDELLDEFIQLWKEHPEIVGEWRAQQERFARETVDEAINLALKDDRDNILQAHLKVLKDIVAFYYDEDKLLEGIDLKDLRVAGKIHGKNASYELIKILPKSKAAWFAEHEFALMSLGVAEGISFVLHPPNHTRAGLAEEAKKILIEALAEGSEHPLVQGKSPEQLQKMLDFMNKAYELFSCFTLWWVDTSKPWAAQLKPDLVENGQYWVIADEAFDSLENYAFAYARDEIEEYEPKFASKKGRNSWANQEPSEAQIKMLNSVYKNKPPKDALIPRAQGGWSKGEMSKRINHAAAMPPVEDIVGKFESQIDKLKAVL